MKRQQDDSDRTGRNQLHTFDILYLLLEGIETGMLHGSASDAPSLGEFFAGQDIPLERQRWRYAWEFLREEELVSEGPSLDASDLRTTLTQEGRALLGVLRVRYNDPRSLLYVRSNSEESRDFIDSQQLLSMNSRLKPHMPRTILSSLVPAEVPSTPESRARNTERITAQKERHKQSFQHQRFEGRDR